MEQAFSFAYGDQQLETTLCAGEIEVLLPQAATPIADLGAAFRRAVEADVIGTPPLGELLAPDDQVTVVISDITRSWMHQELICPLVVDYVCDVCGVKPENFVFLIALGTHRGATEEEKRKLVGRAYGRVRVENHDASHCVAVGCTSRGTPVEVNPLVVGRKVILLGGTVHHLLAGYGGGRKSILPGVASERTIQRNHSLALDPVLPRSSAKVGCGKLAGNPVHEDMMEACRLVKPLFGINLVVDAQGRHVALPSGDPEAAWLRSTQLVDQFNGVPIARRGDVVVASCGGYPKDIDLYQSSKTLINAFEAVRPGGEILLLDRCNEGGGPPAFFDWIVSQTRKTLDRDLRQGFTIAGYIFYAMCEMASKARIRILTELPEDKLTAMGMEKLAALPQRLDYTGKRVIVMPQGASTVPLPPVG